MATGNLFLGTARRKVGDVVLYRRDGQQVARVRVRQIANPRSVSQALTRNYLAPVSKFYAPLAGVLERSWEGLNKAQSHNAFTSANVKLARESGWYVPKGAGFVPLPYQVSKGILPSLNYSFAAGSSDFILEGLPSLVDNDSLGSFSQSMINGYGLSAGDQVTFVFCLDDNTNVRPVWCRLLLDPSSVVPLNNLILPAEISLSFEYEYNRVSFLSVSSTIIAGCVIVSRYAGNVWRRSTQFMAVAPDYLAQFTGETAYDIAINSYRDVNNAVYSDVYLNGSTGIDNESSQPMDTITITTRNGSTFFASSLEQGTVQGGGTTYYVMLLSGANISGAGQVSVPVMIGSDFLTTLTTKGAVTGYSGDVAVVENNAGLKEWLISHGVASNLFPVEPVNP